MDQGLWAGYNPDIGRLEAEVKVLRNEVTQLKATVDALQKYLKNVDFSSLIRFGSR